MKSVIILTKTVSVVIYLGLLCVGECQHTRAERIRICTRYTYFHGV